MAINKNVLAEKQATVLSEDGNTMYATIQMRHGKESEMDKSKFVPAEMGVATDTKKAFMAFAPNDVKEIAFKEDLDSGGGGGTGGTTNYNNLSNKPQLNGVTLEGNKTLDQVGVLAKNQGANNSGKFLSVGRDGNVVPADAPSGGTVDPEQIKQAVNGYLEENPVSGMTAEQEQQLNQNTTDVADLKSASNNIQKTIGIGVDPYGLLDEDYEAVDITDQFTAANINSWDMATNNNLGRVLSPIFKMPQKIVIINTNTTVLSNRVSRFLDGESTDSNVATNDTEYYRSERWCSDVPANETKTIYTYEFGRSGREYMQIAWQNGSFSSWKGKFQVIAYYTDKRPQYEEISDSDGFEHDVDIKWGAAVCGNVGLTYAVLLAIVPFIPGIKYTVKGGNWSTSISTNISNAYALYDDSLLNNYYPALGSPAGSIIPVQPPYRNIMSDIVVVESGATNGGKGIVTYTCPDPSETKDYPKWIAFAMANAAKPNVENTSIVYSYDIEMIQSWVNGRISELDEGRAGWGYVTRFDTLIDRPGKAKGFVNPYEYLDDSGSRYTALQAGSSPLCGARWVIFGDSVMDNFGGDSRIGDGFVSKISREFGLIPDNRARSGSNINDGDETYSSVCGIKMLDAFLQEIEDGTTEQPGYITIAYGHNSYGSHVGSADDTSAEHRNSICGAMKYFVEKIREKCPGTVFGFVLPYQSDWSKSTAPNEYKDIAAGRQAMLSVLQLEGYQVPYIDMWTQSGITVNMLPDAIHPSSDQAKNLYYHALRRFMMGL